MLSSLFANDRKPAYIGCLCRLPHRACSPMFVRVSVKLVSSWVAALPFRAPILRMHEPLEGLLEAVWRAVAPALRVLHGVLLVPLAPPLVPRLFPVLLPKAPSYKASNFQPLLPPAVVAA